MLAPLTGGVGPAAAGPTAAQPIGALTATAPAAVADAQAVRDAAGTYQLTWTASATATTARVYASTDPAAPPAHRRLVASTVAPTATVSGLDPRNPIHPPSGRRAAR
ncbi:hypothetical protein [Streptomyces sp. NPDC051677]|uniref:hypothetical protein n=1 Tax=Streptomyces sp. NPDC051677 TaxID=3365669 RepID=UPI0037CF02F1